MDSVIIDADGIQKTATTSTRGAKMNPAKFGTDLCSSCYKRAKCDNVTPGTSYCNAYRRGN